MGKNVMISIIGQQDAQEEDAIELITTGQIYDRNGKTYIRYNESELTGYSEKTTITLKIDGERLTITRSGESNSQMVFEKGKKHLGHYETPFGCFTVGTVTDKLEMHMDDNGGEISARYVVELNNVPQSVNDLNLKVTPCMS